MLKPTNHVCVSPEGLESQVFFYHRLPGTEEESTFVLGDNLEICEVHSFKESRSSWFTSSTVVQDGSLYLVTPVDVLFLIIPILEAQTGNEWVDISDCLEVSGCLQIKQALHRDPSQLDCICESKDQEGRTVYRLSEPKTIVWLDLKIQSLIESLESVEKAEHHTIAYALDLMKPYLTGTWMKKLLRHFSSEHLKKCDLTLLRTLVDEKALEILDSGTPRKSCKKRQVEDSVLSKAEERRQRKQQRSSKGTVKLTQLLNSKSTIDNS